MAHSYYFVKDNCIGQKTLDFPLPHQWKYIFLSGWTYFFQQQYRYDQKCGMFNPSGKIALTTLKMINTITEL